MSRKNEGKTNPTQLKKDREKYLKNSENKIEQLKKILGVLKENGVEDSLVQKLYKKEMARKERLTKLSQED